MERKFEKWFEINYRKMVYGPIHTEGKKFYDLEEAYNYANEIKDKFPMAQVWINECTLEKKEIK